MPEAQRKLIGKRFGKIVVVSQYDDQVWLCLCDCGKTKYLRQAQLRIGLKSCGCIPPRGITRRRTPEGKMSRLPWTAPLNKKFHEEESE